MQVFAAVTVVHSGASYAAGEAEECHSSCHFSLTAEFCSFEEAGWLPKENCGDIRLKNRGKR